MWFGTCESQRAEHRQKLKSAPGMPPDRELPWKTTVSKMSQNKKHPQENKSVGDFTTKKLRWGACLETAAAAKSLQLCLTLCDPIDGGPPGSVPGILQARTLEWVAISFSNAWKWKWSHSLLSYSLRPHGLQPTRLLRRWDFPGKSTGVGCHCLLQNLARPNSMAPALALGNGSHPEAWLLSGS